jgi:hypothetical protein
MDIYNTIANDEYGVDFEQLDQTEKDWIISEVDNLIKK